VGLLTCLNDILVPHLKSIFDLGYAEVMLVQFAFFSAYFLFSVPWSRVVNAVGYQRTMVIGLVLMALGALLFVPAASLVSFPVFLGASSFSQPASPDSRSRPIPTSSCSGSPRPRPVVSI
jgi:FHS family L-fucose permease-like MFS transporter